MNNTSKYHVHLIIFHFFCFTSICIIPLSGQKTNATTSTVDVGLISDEDNILGKGIKTCMTMALQDFYATHNNYTTRIVFHYRDSKSAIVEAASAAIDLLKNVQVHAILGPQGSTQADFVTDIGNKARVPIISQATNPSLSSIDNPYFIRAAQDGTSQIGAITTIFKILNWHEVVLIYEDTDYGRGMVPYVTDSLLKINVHVKHRCSLSVSATNDHILKELYKLMTMQTRVFIVNMLPTLASRFFLKAKQAGMMSKGYAWIITDGLTNLLESLDSHDISSMQGVIGVRPYVPKSKELDKFNERWRRTIHHENPEIVRFELNVFGLWAYDSVHALAIAVEKAKSAKKTFQKPVNVKNLTDLDAIGTSRMGKKLRSYIRNTRFKGLSGDFHIVDGELRLSDFEIINVIGKETSIIGFWTPEYGVSKSLRMSDKKYTTSREDLGTILWPGESNEVPRGWDFPANEKKLRVGIPVNSFDEFIKVGRDPKTNIIKPTGFCVAVFEETLRQPTWSYAVPYEYIPFERENGSPAGYYNDLVYQIYLGKFDAVVGDITILANRSSYVDFSLPYAESGVAMIVPIEGDDRKNAWIFMDPLSMDLWLTSGAFFIFTGFVVWVLEHSVNHEFRGTPIEQLGMIFWFSFSTMVFAHKEKLISNLSRFVVVVWIFLVLVLTSSYTASLTSMLTVQKLQPTITNINDLKLNGEYIGVKDGSFVIGFLTKHGFDKSRLRNYSSVDEFDKALTKGSKNGGVGAVVDELPYLRLILSKHCTKYTVVGPTYETEGFGFAFPKGSPLVPDFSRAILQLKEDNIVNIKKQWFDEANCVEQTGNRMGSYRLTLESFKGLFLIAGISSISSLVVFLAIFLYNNKATMSSNETVIQKIIELLKSFHLHKENPKNASSKTILPPDRIAILENTESEISSPHSTAISISNHGERNSTPASATEPGTPVYEIEIVGSSDEEESEKHGA